LHCQYLLIMGVMHRHAISGVAFITVDRLALIGLQLPLSVRAIWSREARFLPRFDSVRRGG